MSIPPHSLSAFSQTGVNSAVEVPWQGEALREVQPNLYVLHPPHRFLPVGGLP